MKLKKLILHGFKSFADRTELTFDDGITGIVGPNGCGKSNIVDAFKWVLGEQSAKNIRGRQMVDVIFNGSASRKSMGMAEVSLIFESDGTLPEELGPEVAITRRLYRSGQSEYLINNKPARLRDIKEMFLDTGIGVDAYSLIEQGKVDLLLQASNQERRLVLEEAAGISKYKARRKEAQRRLENVEQNLLRVNDIIAEVEKHLRSVKLQAGKARNYQQYVTRLNELKSQYYLSEYHRLIEEQGNLRVELDSVNQRLKDLQVNADIADSNRSKFDLEIIELSNRIASVENQLTHSDAQISSGLETINLLSRSIDEQTENLNRARNRLQTYHHQISTIAQQRHQLEGQLETIVREKDESAAEISEIQEQLNQKELIVTELEHQIDTEKSNLIELMRQIAQINNQLNQSDVRKENIDNQRNKLIERRAQLASQRESLRESRDNYQSELDRHREKSQQTEAQLEDIQRRFDELNSRADELTRQLADMREKRSALRSRYEVLEDMEKSLQGLDAGVKTLMERKENNPDEFTQSMELIADVITTDLEHAELIETALAGRDQYIAIDSIDLIEKHRDMLAELDGRVNFFPLDILPAIINARDFTQFEGVVGLASDFVRCDEKYEHLVRLLLGKTLIVDNISKAIELKKQDTSGMRFVTLNNELIESDGSIHIGSAGSSSGLISRKSELQQIGGQLNEIERQIENLEDQSARTSDERRQLAEQQKNLRTQLYELKSQIVQIQTNLENVISQLEKIDQEEPIIESELAGLDEQERFIAQQREQFQQKLNNYESQQSQARDNLSQLQSQLELYHQEREELVALLTEKKIVAGQLAEKHKAIVDTINSLTQREHQIRSTCSQSESEIQSALSRIVNAERQILQTESKISQAYLDKQTYQSESAELRQQRDSLREQMQKIVNRHQEIKEQMAQVDKQSQELALKINELTVRQETLIQRVQEELNIDIEHTYSDYEYQEKDWQQVHEEINELKGKISRLGNVNMDAIGEQEELEARLVFLTSQRDDLAESQSKLNQLIEKLDEESQNRFIETFEAVRSNFNELFRKLFGGGKAELVLDNPENVLESGIDIITRPPGKETQSVTLLSGGEKTMTTVALLMAIFKSKPSPFCILDEVDAALDELNIDRFNTVLQEFLRHSQFVIITHNKRMMSYANILYGITMQEAGVSKQVAVRFDGKKPERDEENEAA